MCNASAFCHGIVSLLPLTLVKGWAVAGQSGCCYLAYTNVGLNNGPELSKWMNDPLGYTTIVHQLFTLEARRNVAEQLRSRKGFLATDRSDVWPPPVNEDRPYSAKSRKPTVYNITKWYIW